jgi:hypothetical protein
MLALVDDVPEMLPDVLLNGLLAELLKGLLENELLKGLLLLKEELLNELLPKLKKKVPDDRSNSTSYCRWAGIAMLALLFTNLGQK